MILNERKIKILEAIINDYIKTAEPIGSRTIAKKYDLGISSATIRNEMSDLEDMGFIVAPHASAGRVPSDKGYRLYVDKLMPHRELTDDELGMLQNVVLSNVNQIDYLMQETAKAISLITNYTTIVSEPTVHRTKIKHIQLVPVDETGLVVMLVTDNKLVKNQIIRLDKSIEGLSPETLNDLSLILNANLCLLSAEDINTEVINNLKERFGVYKEIIIPIIKVLTSMLEPNNKMQVYTSGAKNILAFPEFSNLDKARAIFNTLEEKDTLITLLDKSANGHVQVVIGSENDLEQMKECSVIKANYFLENASFGSIGIIGPTRMDYSQVVSVLTAIVKDIGVVVKALTGG